MGAVAEFERALSRVRQREGIALAKKRGVYQGRSPVMTGDQLRMMQDRLAAGISKAQVAGNWARADPRYIGISDRRREEAKTMTHGPIMLEFYASPPVDHLDHDTYAAMNEIAETLESLLHKVDEWGHYLEARWPEGSDYWAPLLRRLRFDDIQVPAALNTYEFQCLREQTNDSLQFLAHAFKDWGSQLQYHDQNFPMPPDYDPKRDHPWGTKPSAHRLRSAHFWLNPQTRITPPEHSQDRP